MSKEQTEKEITDKLKSKLVKIETIDPSTVKPHPKNWRKHPKFQVKEVERSIKKFGWIDSIKVNINTGNIFNGHLRHKIAIDKGYEIPAEFYDLTGKEELAALAMFDKLTMLAEEDGINLEELLREVAHDELPIGYTDAELKSLLGDIGTTGFPDLPSGDRDPYQQMTFTLHDNQVEELKETLNWMKDLGPFDTSLNANRNGNALARMSERLNQIWAVIESPVAPVGKIAKIKELLDDGNS